jgi:hypothetical protein
MMSQIFMLFFLMLFRFRVKLKVDDGTAQAVFVVFDSDMSVLVGTACHELVASAKVLFHFVFTSM